MDSSNAEKRETVAERAWREHPDEMARAHTELQVEVLREQLAAAEAVIERVRNAWNADTGWVDFGESVRAILPVAPSEVLAARDREVAARALESLAADLLDNPRTMWWSNFEGPMVQLDDATGEKVPFDEWLPARIAALRSGTEGSGS